MVYHHVSHFLRQCSELLMVYHGLSSFSELHFQTHPSDEKNKTADQAAKAAKGSTACSVAGD
jgi:hypothetical protein